MSQEFEIFIVTLPGLEKYLFQEVQEAGFRGARAIGGGVIVQGGWRDVWRANLVLRGASKVLARIGEFRAMHLAQLDKRSRKFPWGDFLLPGHKIKVEVTTNRKSKIYHAGAAIERIERAIHEEFGAEIATSMDDADILIKARIDSNLVIFSIDTSGMALHKRGHKQAMGKAPLRETIAAMTLRACDYDGSEPVLDPMCGSGTYVIEAAEIARNLLAGRARHFAFERLVSYDRTAVEAMKANWQTSDTAQHFYGSDRNDAVIGFATENAKRAGVADLCTFAQKPFSDITPPDGPPGLVMINPPYGNRIGNKKQLFALYQSFGDVMRERFTGWRVGMITTDRQLADATKLPWLPPGAPIAHGGLKVRLFRTEAI
ncbi:class I SAM-dependent RNA methyltransferase [Litorimonas sp. RW-G-Af-16]|uniref:THUMP domain-containing class I SAM-dependent RNA methyltransferase n=1 Tax=Litorimonas sp. RW-G-Af-16 TaxID=3241168 RepID=UPI00390C52B9